MLLAAFIFPVALMFLITGSMYTWGIKGSYNVQPTFIELESPLIAETDQLAAVAKAELDKQSIPYPSGTPKIKKGGTSFHLEWSGSARDVVLHPTEDLLTAKLVVKETTWYRNLVQLHKAKGGQPFKVYAAILAASLFLILFSGFLMAWLIPKYRKQVAVASLGGVITFLLMIVLS
jgi:hypothetical protein